ncbi:hypothetical protein PanWU01x14_114720, partial [Parasponia andersonii]
MLFSLYILHLIIWGISKNRKQEESYKRWTQNQVSEKWDPGDFLAIAFTNIHEKIDKNKTKANSPLEEYSILQKNKSFSSSVCNSSSQFHVCIQVSEEKKKRKRGVSLSFACGSSKYHSVSIKFNTERYQQQQPLYSIF